MNAVPTDRKPLVDYGVQIRFIKDLHDTGGGYPDKSRVNHTASPPTNKYGVAVHVQGISGQPYVVMKDGDKGDSYGVQLNSPTSDPPSPYNSLPRRNKGSAELANPFSPAVNTARSPVSPAEDDVEEIFGSPHKRPPGDGQAGTQEEEEGGAGRKDGPPDQATAGEAERSREKSRDEEYNEAGLKPVTFNYMLPRGFKKSGAGYTGSLGRYSGGWKSQESPSESPPKPPPSNIVAPIPEIDTNSLDPINKLISKFSFGTPASAPQTRGRAGARQRLRFDEKQRSKSLDARKDVQPESPSPSSPTLNPYAVHLSSSSTLLAASDPPSSGLRSSPASVSWATSLEAPKSSFKSLGKFVAKDAYPAVAKKPDFTLRSQSQVNEEEARGRPAAFNSFKNGPSESEGSLRRPVNLVSETNGSFKGGSDGSLRKGVLEELQVQLNRCKGELQQVQDELAEERMAREGAESRLRLQEDQLAELQEELRRVSENSPLSVQTDVRTLQADLAEAAMLRRRQDEVLHQRERELTALKGALKEEVECHDKEMETLREQYSQDMDNLRMTMEQFTQSQEQIEEERERVNNSMLTLQIDLEGSRDQEEWRKTQLDATAQELHNTREELQRSRSQRDEFEGELINLKDSLLSAQKQTPASADNLSSSEELRRCHDDLKRAGADLDKQKGELDEERGTLRALKKASGEEKAELLSEISRLKEKSQKDKAELEKSSVSSSGKTVVDHGANQELQEANTRLRERLARMTRHHSSSPRSAEAEEAVEVLEDGNRSLKTQLEEAKRGATRLSKEREELSRRLEERELEREALRRGKIDVEEQKRLLDRALDKINKEMEIMMGDSRQSVATLQTQLEDYRERSRKDMIEAQRNCKDRLVELQRAQITLKAQQEEISHLKKDLLVCSEERDSAQLERDLFSNRLKHLDSELESEKITHTDRSREIRCLEDKVKTMEMEVDEEKNSVELLNDRIMRTRDQVDLLRSELMQERSARHDLEMDKSALERQIKELKSRMVDMEGYTRPSPALNLLENQIQELEERLRSEEREKATIHASQRRLERKLKELNVTLDQERSQHVEQRDQLSMRVKALKRQVDESEGEVERLEGVRRKVLRDLEEQQELQEGLHAKVTALEAELKRKSQHSHRSALGSSTFSSDDDEEGFYDSNVASILNESHTQTSNC
ncbi:cingulin isoform X2 [Pseudoliparis swirei]|uniref:cingulin isoform X2 n=1 Tax=Pseudoliparis swirei TaxID=2059687 RepID=UPI0024BD6D13|nr:cingulin isoform X2 [Pseudoliparis swirei]